MKVKTYTKKTVEIEAFQWNGEHISEFPQWAMDVCAYSENIITRRVVVRTLEGDMKVSLGDYIIKGVVGEVYPCKPDIFKLTYEL